MQPWPVDATLWFITQQRHDGAWVVIVGMRGAPVMVGRPFDSEEAANRAVGRLWGRIQRQAHDVLIGAESPEYGPI